MWRPAREASIVFGDSKEPRSVLHGGTGDGRGVLAELVTPRRILLVACLVLLAWMHGGCVGAIEWEQRKDALRAATGSTGDTITIPCEHLPDVRLGMTPDEVAAALKDRTSMAYDIATGFAGKDARLRFDPLQFEFLISEGDIDVLCLHAIVIRAYFMFVFEHDALAKIVPYPRVGWEVAREHKGVPVMRPKRIAAQERIRRALDAPGVTPEAFRSLVKSKSERALSATVRHMEPAPAIEFASGLTDVLGIMLGKGTWESRARAAWEPYDEQRRHFDPKRIDLGMTPAEADAVYGPPRAVYEAADGSVLHIYEGDKVENYSWPTPFVGVQFVEGRTIAVLTAKYVDSRCGGLVVRPDH